MSCRLLRGLFTVAVRPHALIRLLTVVTAVTTIVLFVLLYSCHVTTMPDSTTKLHSSPVGRSIHRQILKHTTMSPSVARILQPPSSTTIGPHVGVGKFPLSSSKSGPDPQSRTKVKHSTMSPSVSRRLQPPSNTTIGPHPGVGKYPLSSSKSGPDPQSRAKVKGLFPSVSRGLQPPSNTTIGPHPGVGKSPLSSSKSGPDPQSRAKGKSSKIPYMGNYDCDDRLCTEFLTPINTCRCQLKSPTDAFRLNGSCHFMDGRNRAPVALASFPGSGNTWVRGLLEQATGICTGAVYCDNGLRRSGFNGEGYTSGVVIAVKTHFIGASWSYSSSKSRNGPPWGSGILIIRNPRDALVAEWNRELSRKLKSSAFLTKQNGSSHLKYVGKNYFGDYNRWDRFVRIRSKLWASYFTGWVLSATRRKRPLLVVKYEDIKTDAIKETERMLRFLKVPFSKEALKKRMSASFETFLRRHPKEFEHFTSYQEEYICKQVESVIAALKRRNNGVTLGLEEYLEPTV